MEYKFNEIEKKWQQYWSEHKTFRASNDSDKPKYYVLDMFPYPSGAGLHVGHPLGYIASDIYARYKRLSGFNVLHPMGYDSFGLPAEQYAIQTGQHPAITTENNITRYREQLDQIGFSFDWDREVRTSDPKYYKWTQWIFLQLYNAWFNKKTGKAEHINTLFKEFERNGNRDVQAACSETENFSAEDWQSFDEKKKQEILLNYRLAYLSETMVNWCPQLGTVLANDEVKDGLSERGGYPVVRKKMQQWSMRITAYAQRLLDGLEKLDWTDSMKEMQRNWIGRSEGAMIRFRLITGLSKNERTARDVMSAKKDLLEKLKMRAHEKPSDVSKAEAFLWERLKDNQLGYEINRHYPIDQFLADFVCLDKNLIIKIDGEYQSEKGQQDYHQARIFKLDEVGYRAIRFTYEEVMNKPDWVCEQIKAALSGSLSYGESWGEDLQIDVFTTRPDTIFGATFMVLAPEYELVPKITTEEQKAEVENYIEETSRRSERDRMADVKSVSGCFTGAYCKHPFTGKKIPVWIADYVLAGYGTGAIMAVPSGDERDWRFANHYNIPIVPVIDGTDIELGANTSKDGELINSDFLNGLQVPEAIKKAIEEIEKHGHGKGTVNFKLRDAAFGRQRYWGEPIPIYYKDAVPYPMDESELPLELPEVDEFLPTEDGEPPLARAKDWKYKGKYEYEHTTMPGWAGSSWYYLRYMDPHNEKEFVSKEAADYWKNVNLYIGGAEHATGHLLYVRFWTKFLNDMDFINIDEPALKLINQGMIQGVSGFIYKKKEENVFVSSDLVKEDEKQDYIRVHCNIDLIGDNNTVDVDGFKSWMSDYENADFVTNGNDRFICEREIEKMSKSKFNVVNPDDLIEQYGADTLRMYEMFLGPLEQHKPWDTKGIEGVFRFLKKLWRLFHDDDGKFIVNDEEPSKEELKSLHATIKKVKEDIERYSFNTAVSQFMICTNELWDLKCSKRQILEPLIITLSPYAPHICEELWQKLGHEESITFAEYPQHNEEYLKESSFSYPISFNGKTRLNLEIPLDISKEEVEKLVLEAEKVQHYLEGKEPKKVIVVPRRIVNIVV